MLLNQFHDILPGSCIKQVEIYLCGSLCGTVIQTTPDEFENGDFTGHFGFVFEENSVRETT